MIRDVARSAANFQARRGGEAEDVFGTTQAEMEQLVDYSGHLRILSLRHYNQDHYLRIPSSISSAIIILGVRTFTPLSGTRINSPKSASS
jgi:hypothetical protein